MLNAALAKSGALDFRWKKNIILFFAYEKGLGHMRKNSLVVVQFSFSLFLRRHKPKIIFGQTVPSIKHFFKKSIY